MNNKEITISCTLSKTFKMYSINEDNLYDEVINKIILPFNSYKYINGNTIKGKKAIKDLKDWIVDDIEIILE